MIDQTADIMLLEKMFSKPRIARYAANPRGAPPEMAYRHNLELAESIIPSLHVLEVALRNAIHQQLKMKYDRTDWWEAVASFEAGDRQEITSIRKKIIDKKQAATPDRIVSEASFGFWVSLFNKRHETEMWKELRLAFPRCPKNKRQRPAISKALNTLRILRNRAAHHDALLWLSPDMRECHMTCMEVITWLEPQLKPWLGAFDRFPAAWSRWMTCPSMQVESSSEASRVM
ncbi:Abi family protein [Pseudomonas capsici]|uniref:Abi family protein n=1 Tax=Pseudomonas capsici TaxID=2810614 RepID=UPI0021F0F3D3|nr:Abi family protein [Pseudomonas capsici]MCV4340215.1 Abi family protein [Pseudomonas capsici]